MEIIEAIRTRRSIHSFRPNPVPKKVLEEILEISLWAPSSSNTQTWEFTVLGGSVNEVPGDRALPLATHSFLITPSKK